jgi:hypothetical protein
VDSRCGKTQIGRSKRFFRSERIFFPRIGFLRAAKGKRVEYRYAAVIYPVKNQHVAGITVLVPSERNG